MEGKASICLRSLTGATPVLRLNVGGKLFSTSVENVSFPKSLLGELCHEFPEKLTKPDEMITIDRNPKGFEVILNIFRSGNFNWSDVEGDYTLQELSKDLEFYKLPSWTKIVKRDSKFLEKKTEMALEAFVADVQVQFDFLDRDQRMAGHVDFVPYLVLDEEVHAFRIVESQLYDVDYFWGWGNCFTTVLRAKHGEPTEEVQVQIDEKQFQIPSLGTRAVELLVTMLKRRGIQGTWVNLWVPVCNSETHSKQREIHAMRITW